MLVDTLGPASASLLATTVISVAPVILLTLFHFCCTKRKGCCSMDGLVLKCMLSFAVGGLLGDTFLHLIPHALDPHDHHGVDSHGHGHSHDHGHSHSHVHDPALERAQREASFADFLGGGPDSDPFAKSAAADAPPDAAPAAATAAAAHDSHAHGHDHSKGLKIGLQILAGMLVFFIVEKIQRIRGGGAGGHGHSHGHGGSEAAHGHSHSHGGAGSSSSGGIRDDERVNSSDTLRRRKAPADASSATASASAASDQPDHAVTSAKMAADLSLLGDWAHNFTDGMAIAASFLVSHKVGMSTTLAVLVHEIPHELGDYALLVNGGYSAGRAILMQLLTATGAYLGTLLGLASGGASSALGALILPFTAGGFIYIAMVEVVPSLMERTSVRDTACEVLSMATGVLLMVLITFIE